MLNLYNRVMMRLYIFESSGLRVYYNVETLNYIIYQILELYQFMSLIGRNLICSILF